MPFHLFKFDDVFVQHLACLALFKIADIYTGATRCGMYRFCKRFEYFDVAHGFGNVPQSAVLHALELQTGFKKSSAI